MIKQWVEERKGYPATAVRPGDQPNNVGVLKIKFPGQDVGGKLRAITWDEFFQKFETKGLAFVYMEDAANGEPSQCYKFISRSRLTTEQ